jgi:hypothetical protein
VKKPLLLIYFIFSFTSIGFSDFFVKPSILSIPNSDLDKKWNGPKGLVIDNLKDSQIKSVQSLKKHFTSINVVAMAVYTYRDPANFFNGINIRYFVFKDAKSCTKFTNSKYFSDKTKALYKKLENKQAVIIDSLEVNKRIIIYDKYWITVSQLFKDEKEHISIGNQYHTKLLKLIKQNKDKPTK